MDTASKIGLLPGFGWIFSGPWWATLLIAWMITPVGHILVGLVLESRLVPILPKHGQFSSFFPGDLFLGAMLAGVAYLAKQLPGGSHWYAHRWVHLLFLGGAVVVAIAWSWVEYKSGAYPARAYLSPTKIYHNGVLYIGYGYVLAMTASIVISMTWRDHPVMLALVVILPFLVWLGFFLRDGMLAKEVSAHKAYLSHVDQWQPIWVAPTIYLDWYYRDPR